MRKDERQEKDLKMLKMCLEIKIQVWLRFSLKTETSLLTSYLGLRDNYKTTQISQKNNT
jgi:hypothetical protein